MKLLIFSLLVCLGALIGLLITGLIPIGGLSSTIKRYAKKKLNFIFGYSNYNKKEGNNGR